MSAISIIRPEELLQLDPLSSGFAHGFGLFETIRVREGRLEFWAAHWQRLVRSQEALGIASSFSREDALAAVVELAAELPEDVLIKLSLVKEGAGSHLFVYSRPATPAPESVGLLIDPAFPINASSPLAGHKSQNYMENLLALDFARGLGCYDIARTNTKGLLAEAAMSNLFFCRAGELCSPSDASGLLRGVVREALLGKLDVAEAECAPEELLDADAVFLTNSNVGVLPVDWLLKEGRRLELSSPAHPILGEMRAAIHGAVGLDSVRL